VIARARIVHAMLAIGAIPRAGMKNVGDVDAVHVVGGG
jgi:hypothetical protein